MKRLFEWMIKKPMDGWKLLSIKSRFFFLVVVGAGLSLLMFGISLLVLNSSLGRGRVISKIQQKTGLDSELKRITWSPWGGLMCNDLALSYKMDKTSGEVHLASAKKLAVTPYWKKLFQGELEIRRVSIDSPDVVVSLELLAELASRYQPESKPVPLAVKKKTAQPTSEEKSGPKQPTTPKPKSAHQQKPKKQKPASTEKPQSGAVVKKPKVELPFQIQVKNASFKVISLEKNKELLHVSGIAVDTPIFGEDSEGVIKIGVVKLLGLSDLVNLKQKLEWQSPYLSMVNDTPDLLGLEGEWTSTLKLNKRHLKQSAFQCRVVLPQQRLEVLHHLDWLAVSPDADEAQANFLISGYLFAPMSWRGNMLIQAKNMHIKELHGGQSLQFDEVAVPAAILNGSLHWGGVRFVGEDLSVLGNGELSTKGEISSVTRIIASPEYSEGIHRALSGSMIAGGRRGWWSNLDTPDLQFRDIIAMGNIKDPILDIGHKKAPMKTSQALRLMLQFIKREMREEGKRLPSPPNHEMLPKI